MKKGPSTRIDWLEQSEIRNMSRECRRLDGINLGQGICPLESPAELLNAASEAVLADRSIYSAPEGIEPLRRQIASKARAYNDLDCSSEHVCATAGATGAFACTAEGLLDPGDEVIVFEPYYGYHVNTLRAAKNPISYIPLQGPDWTFGLAELEEAYSEDTEAILVNTPMNPLGKVFEPDELELIAEFCRNRDLLAITDEIYEYFLYGDSEHVSLASFPGMWDRTVTISGFSKIFAITGWRVGYAIAPEALIEPITLVNDLHYVCAPKPLQHGVTDAMDRLDDEYYQRLKCDFRDKRDRFCEALEDVGLEPIWPDGAYYVLADISALECESSKAAAMQLLEEYGVASVPGSAFFQSETGEQLVRFCFAQDDDVLDAAIESLIG
jgi:aminotransferase